MLTLLPDLVYPVTGAQINALMDNVVQLNLVDAGLTSRDQDAIDIMLDCYEIKAKTNGAIDYTGLDGHRRLHEDAMRLVNDGNPIMTRHGDMTAAHVAIGYHDAQINLRTAGMPLLSSNRNDLLALSRDILQFPKRTEARMALFLRYLRKKKLTQ